MINVEFLIVTYLVGLFVDWIFQFDWQASNKSKWGKNDNRRLSQIALLSHSSIYAATTSIIVYLLIKFDGYYLPLMNTVLFTTHYFIDSRIPVKAIMKYIKGMTDEQINDYVNYGFMHIGIDHRLHELVILILSMIIK